MIVTIFGAGYVGLVTGACLAKLGHQVMCADINVKRIAMLKKGECPIYEAGLAPLLHDQVTCGRITFTTDLVEAVRSSQVFIIATGTPSLADGRADLSQVIAVAELVSEHAITDSLLIIKSTVPLGTGKVIEALVKKNVMAAKKSINITVASNPEFLREGCAIDDFLNAERIIVGGDEHALPLLKKLYQPLIDKGIPFLAMDRTSAELTKYSANAMLACRISFINQISQLAEAFNADIDKIREGIGLDSRIGPHFLQAGIGYGGSCFPKDVRALSESAKAQGLSTSLLDAIDEVNTTQKAWLFNVLTKHFNRQLKGLRIGVWGLAFKPDTDDLREASSLVAIKVLLKEGVKIIAFDPVAMAGAQAVFSSTHDIVFCKTLDEVFTFKLDGLIIATEWAAFKHYPLARLCQYLKGAPLFDGRNCFSLTAVKEAGIAHYYSVGRPVISIRECVEPSDHAN